MEPTLNETSTDGLTLRSVDQRTKQATDPIIRSSANESDREVDFTNNSDLTTGVQ